MSSVFATCYADLPRSAKTWASDLSGRLVAYPDCRSLRIIDLASGGTQGISVPIEIDSVAVSPSGAFVGYSGGDGCGVVTPHGIALWGRCHKEENARFSPGCGFSLCEQAFFVVNDRGISRYSPSDGRFTALVDISAMRPIPPPVHVRLLSSAPSGAVGLSVAAGQDFAGVACVDLETNVLRLIAIPDERQTSNVVWAGIGGAIYVVYPLEVIRYSWPDLVHEASCKDVDAFQFDSDGFSNDIFGLRAWEVAPDRIAIATSANRIAVLDAFKLTCLAVSEIQLVEMDAWAVDLVNCSPAARLLAVMKRPGGNRVIVETDSVM